MKDNQKVELTDWDKELQGCTFKQQSIECRTCVQESRA